MRIIEDNMGKDVTGVDMALWWIYKIDHLWVNGELWGDDIEGLTLCGASCIIV